MLYEKAGNPLAQKELQFVSRFWEPESTQINFSKSFYFGVDESAAIINLIGDDYGYYVRYRNANLKRIDDFVDQVKKRITQKSRILDIGCGFGQIGYRLQKMGHEVIGIDHSSKNISMGLKILEQVGSSMKLQLGDALENEFEDQYFDVIISCDVIEHIHQQDLFLNNIFRMLRPGGIAFIGTDNETRVRLGVWIRRLLCIFAMKNPFKWKHAFADWEGGHCALITPSKLYDLALKTGFQNCHTSYSKGYSPFLNTLLSPKFLFVMKKN